MGNFATIGRKFNGQGWGYSWVRCRGLFFDSKQGKFCQVQMGYTNKTSWS